VWRRVAFPLSLVAAVVAAAFAASSLPAAPGAPGREAASFPGGAHYSISCSISHQSNDDPIVFPAQPGRSHHHTFIGNRTVDAFATPASLRRGPTSCSDPGDSSGYWFPSLFVGAASVEPRAASVFYVKRARVPLSRLPKGLVMIAGNAAARSPQPKNVVAWSCGDDVGRGQSFSRVPGCRADEWLHLLVTFPSCWNGRTLDSKDHKRHMKYLSRGLCPASHPIPLPTLVVNVMYPPVPLGAQVATGHYAAHADFMNGWNADVLTRMRVSTS
jgi:Domain of unknown function (DUF1996)